jgi:hypothetical protein
MLSLEDMKKKGKKVLLYYKKENKAWLREHVSHFQSTFRERLVFRRFFSKGNHGPPISFTDSQ